MNSKDRKLTTVYAPPSQPGFLGQGHVARPVIGVEFSQSDPFIMLMDDMLEKTDNNPVGGPHPHAGFETVSLVLKGELGEGTHAMKAGDFEIMTAGSGIVHTETISRPTEMRLLQLWLNLPKKDRKALPRIQRLEAEHVPNISEGGVSIRVYSGTFGGVSSPIRNHTPLIVAEIVMEARASMAGILPADFSAFLYVIQGRVHVGKGMEELPTDHVGWLDRSDLPEDSQLDVTAGDGGAHFVLYAARPQHHEIVSHGPFIADSMDDIRQLYAEYRAGKMRHITEVPSEQKLVY
jgi:redox-sensitive bicupin YhaK (pirin superfamily)